MVIFYFALTIHKFLRLYLLIKKTTTHQNGKLNVWGRKIPFEACCQELLALSLFSLEQGLNIGVKEEENGKEGRERTWKNTDQDYGVRGREERVVKIRVGLQDWNGNNNPGKSWQNLFSGYRCNLRTEGWLVTSDFPLMTLQSASLPAKLHNRHYKPRITYFSYFLPEAVINQGIAMVNRTT